MRNIFFSILLFIICFQTPLMASNYSLSIRTVLPASFHGFIAEYQDLTPPPKPGEGLVIPFSRDKFCRAEVEKVEQNLLVAKSINCPQHLLKVGQRLIIKRAHAPKVAQQKQRPIKQVEKKASIGPIFVQSTNLDSSTILASASVTSFVTKGSYYKATSVMGMECSLKVSDVDGTSVTLDSSDCPFERELSEGYELIPLKK